MSTQLPHMQIRQCNIMQVSYDLTHWEPDSVTGDQYLFLAVDHFSKVCFARPLRDKSMESLRVAIEEMMTELGIPRATLSDNGKEFRNRLVEDLLNREVVEIRHSLPYHSRTNGGSERANRTICKKVCNRMWFVLALLTRALCLVAFLCRLPLPLLSNPIRAGWPSFSLSFMTTTTRNTAPLA